MIHLVKQMTLTGMLCLFLVIGLQAQIAVLQYRHVPQENIAEFIHRETTYWSEVAQKAIDKGELLQWELWQRFGGVGLDEDSYNFLFVNVLPNKAALDDMGSIWNAQEALPDVRPADIETGSLSHVVHSIVVWRYSGVGIQDANFVRLNYDKVSNMNDYVTHESEVWNPFIEATMKAKKTSCIGWAGYRVAYPQGSSIPFNAFTVDSYEKLSEAVAPTWASDVEFPDMTEYVKTRDRLNNQVYGLIKRVEAKKE